MNEREEVVESSALAALDGSPGVTFEVNPIFDGLVEQHGGDPRGVRVRTWEEVSYVGGKRERRDEPGSGVG